MGHSLPAGADAILMDARDHVATALRDLQAGDVVRYQAGGRADSVTLMEAVSFGHKLAISDIPEGTEVRKYGEVIGRAVSFIEAGRHVHIHNIEGIRGRGDQAEVKKGGGAL